MKRTGPSVEVKALTRSIKEVENRFLRPHLLPTKFGTPGKQEVLDVAAYVVLVHGALEGFVESLAQWLLKRSVSNWTAKKKATRCTVSLLLYHKPPAEDIPGRSVFDNVRLSLDEAKKKMSLDIHDNHGITPRHLRAMFMPLGVDVPSDPVLTASLELLITMRHQWAHQDHRRAKILKSAKDAQTTVSDCLTLAKKLSAGAATVKP
jgi:hypothetical protein